MNPPTSNQPKVDNSLHWENPRICCTCTFYYEDAADPIQPGCPACALHEFTGSPEHRACAHYTPKKTD